MKLGRLQLRHTFLGETDYVIIRWFKTSSPLTQATGMVEGITVDEVVYPAPHTEESLMIEDLDPVMYDVKAYRSADGITPDEQIFTLAGDAGARSTYSTTTIEYIVDRGSSGTDPDWSDPISETNELRDERLFEEEYAVFFRGIGQRGEDEFTDRSDDGGGFDLENDELFNSGARIFVTIQNRVDGIDAGSGSGSGSGAEVDGIVVIDEDQDFDPVTMGGKLLYVDYPSAVVGVLSFPNLSLLADCSFKIATHDGLQTYLSLQLDAGDTVRFMGEDKNVIHMGKSEELSIMIRNNAMYVLADGTNYKKLGQRIWGDKQELNTIYRNGTQYAEGVHPRLEEFINALPGAQVVSEATWATSQVVDGKTVYPNKGKFATSPGFVRVPDDRNRFLRSLEFTDGTNEPDRLAQGPGGYQVDAFSTMDVDLIAPKGNSYTGAPNTERFANGSNNPEDITTPVTIDTGYDETRPENTGLLPLLCV